MIMIIDDNDDNDDDDVDDDDNNDDDDFLTKECNQKSDEHRIIIKPDTVTDHYNVYKGLVCKEAQFANAITLQ